MPHFIQRIAQGFGRAHAARRAQAAPPVSALEALLQSGQQLCIVAAVATTAAQAQALWARMAELQRTQEAVEAKMEEMQRKFDAQERKADALQQEVAVTKARVDAIEVRATVVMALMEQLSETRIRQLLAENAMLHALLDARDR